MNAKEGTVKILHWRGDRAVGNVVKNREKVVIYGIGDNFIRCRRALFERFQVVALIDKDFDKQGLFYNGIQIMGLENINNVEFDKVVITPNKYTDIKNEIISYGISEKKISSIFECLSVYKVCFYCNGSGIDNIISINYINKFAEKYNTEITVIFLYADELFKVIVSKLNINKNIEIYYKDEFIDKKYDLIIELKKYPQIITADREKQPLLLDYIQSCEKFKAFYARLFDKSVNFETNRIMLQKIWQRKKIQQPDVFGYMGIVEEFSTIVMSEIKPYIVVQNVMPWKNIPEAEAWFMSTISEIVRFLAERYCDYEIIVIGDNIEIPGIIADVKYVSILEDMQETIRFLEQAALFVGLETPLVHYRAALSGKTSIVIFGPSDVDFYGYDMNINVYSSACYPGCENIDKMGNICCVNTVDRFTCLKSISSDRILQEIQNNESKWMI